jgi:hypothetical protein
MKIAIMQPYFFPYIGYFQLINLVDEFIIYDNAQYSKKGWINRNRILTNHEIKYISLSLKKDSYFLNINQRYLAETWSLDRKKVLNQIIESYKKAPQFEIIFPLIEKCLFAQENNLNNFLIYKLQEICSFLSINTKLTLSSSIFIDQNLNREEKIIALCKARNSTSYINSGGGIDLYSKENFYINKIKIKFLVSNPKKYMQFSDNFIPFLSIIDVLMFNSLEEIRKMLDNYELL